ncbi:MAG: four helix bundle protein [candidate division SR1 bacterium CG_4_9_14_3_um_filter_40_9]|nr:MAG: four helix bundle protein [candidate division SR1 bacterium CG_4_9_14_3_um_filter_40_9]
MAKKTFEDLEIRNLGMGLVFDLSKIFYDKGFRNFDFQSQIMRAAISATNNIAEGHEKGTNPDLIKFLYIAKGSIGEVRSMLYIAKKLEYISEKQFTDFKFRAMQLGTKIYNFIAYLKNAKM